MRDLFVFFKVTESPGTGMFFPAFKQFIDLLKKYVDDYVKLWKIRLMMIQVYCFFDES